MVVKIKDRDIELKYSFNSFKYMEDLDLSVLQEAETKPLKLVRFVEILATGAINNNPKVVVGVQDIQDFLEEESEKGTLGELLGKLIELLQASSFFQSLQGTK
jgi:hypothetical protein